MGPPDVPGVPEVRAQVTEAIKNKINNIYGHPIPNQHLLWGDLYILVTVILQFLSEEQLEEYGILSVPVGLKRGVRILVYGGKTPSPGIAVVTFEYAEIEQTSWLAVRPFTAQDSVAYRIRHQELGPDLHEKITGKDQVVELEGHTYTQKIEQIIEGLAGAIARITGLEPLK